MSQIMTTKKGTRKLEKRDAGRVAISVLVFTVLAAILLIPVLVLSLLLGFIVAIVTGAGEWAGEMAMVMVIYLAPILFLFVAYPVWLLSLRTTGLSRNLDKRSIRLSAILPAVLGAIGCLLAWLAIFGAPF